MKRKLTAKEIRNYSGKKLAIGYCNAYHLLKGIEPYGYNCGVYGWNFDVYYFEGITITTGYRNLVGNRCNYELLNEYEKKAEEVCKGTFSRPYEEIRNDINNLLGEFLEKCFA